MGNIIFDFAPEEFLGDTSPRTNQLYVPGGSGASSTSPGTRTSMLHTIDDAELLHQNLSTSGGQFSVLNSYTDIDENGFLMDLSPVFSLYVYETNLAIVLGYLSSKEMAILNEVTPYTYTGFEGADENISIFSSAYNGLTDPSIELSETIVRETGGISYEVDGLVTRVGGSRTGPTLSFTPGTSYDYYTYSVNLSPYEASGLRNRFGSPTGHSAGELIADAIETVASEVVSAYQSKRTVFKRVKRTRVDPSDFGDIDPVTFGRGASTTSALDTDSAEADSDTTSTSRSY